MNSYPNSPADKGSLVAMQNDLFCLQLCRNKLFSDPELKTAGSCSFPGDLPAEGGNLKQGLSTKLSW